MNEKRNDEQGAPEGMAQVHMYPVRNVLHPRGSMKKESVGGYLSDRLQGAWESWTDPQYGDNPEEKDLIEHLVCNLVAEVDAAIAEFTNALKPGDFGEVSNDVARAHLERAIAIQEAKLQALEGAHQDTKRLLGQMSKSLETYR